MAKVLLSLLSFLVQGEEATLEKKTGQHSRATTWPGSTSRTSHDNVAGPVRSLSLRSVNVCFLRVFYIFSFSFLSDYITRKCQ